MERRPGSWHGQFALLVAASVLLIALGGSFHHHHAIADADHGCSVCLAFHAGGQAVASAPAIEFTTPECSVVEMAPERAAFRASPVGVARGPPTVA